MTNSSDGRKSSRSWKSYFFEFLMLFLAVTLGFFVENQRENYNDRQQEEEYMQMMLDDIEADLAEGDKTLKRWENINRSLDTLLQALSSKEIVTNSNHAYRLWKTTIGYPSMIRNDRTIVQLKNDGGLRLIRVKEVSDAIMKYDQLVRNVYSQQDLMDGIISNQMHYMALFDFIEFAKNGSEPRKIPLIKGGEEVLSEAYARQELWQYAISVLMNRYASVRAQGIETSNLIKKYYK